MSWYVPFAESIKKRACRYLLQRYLGQYLEEKLTLEQLTVDLYKGTGSVSDVTLDCQAINELCASQGLPVEVIEGHVGTVSVSIPWSAPLSNDSFVDVTDLEIIVRPKARVDDGTSVLESMWSSMSSSMQLAKDCLEKEGISTTTMGQPLEGLEHFAQIIDSILSRIKVRLSNSVIKLEHCPNNGNTCLTLQINVKNMEYFDEAGSDPPDGTNEESSKYICSSFTTRHLIFEGISLYTNENIMRDSNPEHLAFASNHNVNKNEFIGKKSSGMQRSNIYFSCDMNSILKENVDKLEDEHVITRTHDGITESDVEETINKPVLFGQLMGRQEIQIKMKQSENILGPKVQLDITVGSLTCFITPRQLHLLIEVVQALSRPDVEDTRNKTGLGTIGKPMTSDHFKLVEADLQSRLKSPCGDTGLSNVKGWSTAQIGDDSDNESEFQSFRAFRMSESVMSNNSSLSMTSSIGSSTSQVSSRLNAPTNSTGSTDALHISKENGSEITNYNVRFASVAVIILHEDILTTSSGLCGVGEPRLCHTSIDQLITESAEFFGAMGLYSAFGAKDFMRATASFDKSCKLNHIRILAAPLIVEGHEHRGPSGSSIEASVTAAKLHIYEMRPLKNDNIPLLHFLQMDKPMQIPLVSRPQLKASFKFLQRPTRQTISRRLAPSISELNICLEPCICEVDISMIDRISAFIVPPLWTTSKTQPVKPLLSESKPYLENSCEYKLTCEELQIKLRFPVIDLRPKHDPLRMPWWERNVHSDFVIITLNSATGSITPIADNGQKYELQCQEIVLDYWEGEGEKKLPIGRAGSRSKLMSSVAPIKEKECWPRLTLNVFPAKKKYSLDSSSEGELPISEAMTTSIGGALRNNLQIKDPSPFSAKRMMYKSDTSHASGEADELIIPGTREEMEDFYEISMKNSLIQIVLSLEYVSIHLRSKHLYEKIYNHINTDLLLWESNSSFMASAGAGSIMQDTPMFSMCKSGIRYDSESSTQDSDSDSNSNNGAVFYSICDRRIKHGNQNSVGFKLTIKQGLLTMFTPVRDSANHVIPGQQGEFVIRAADLDLFSVSGFHGDPELAFLCLQTKRAELFHSGLHSVAMNAEPLRLVDSCLPSHVQKTIFPNSDNAHGTDKILERDMVTVALRIQANHEKKLKHIKMAMGIQDALLMHRSAPPAHTWLTQLIDLFDVQDLPVQGYQPSNVITEIHLHIWDSIVEYRPLHLPLISRLVVGTFSMSSNIITQSTGVNLRFIAEDCSLQLSDISHLRTQQSKNILQGLNFVSVVELGLFELSLRLNDKNCNTPRVDLRASNNALHIRTCADSGRALAQLISYIAEDGDLITRKQDKAIESDGTLLPDMEKIIPRKECRKQEEKVNELMAEAMLESLKASTSEIDPDAVGKGVEVFFFPDEAKQLDPLPEPKPNTSNEKPEKPILQESPSSIKKKNTEIDDDFCIVGDEPGVGVYPRHGHPEIRWLTKEPFYILDNHFSMPTCKTDLLKTPRDFPVPLFRYTLCEITLTWYIYGGNDFPDPLENSRKKVVTIDDTSMNMGKLNSVRYTAMGSNTININRTTATKNNNKIKNPLSKNGLNRKENILIEVHLNKVRFTHESYPDSSCYASRQVLLVGDLEIRDRLEISQINKLLYQQSSEQRPRQSHANMIVIKATHTRPDPNQVAQECSLRVSLLPLRLNVDQDTLLFMIQFFSELSGAPIDIKPKADVHTQGSRHSTPTHQVPFMTVEDSTEMTDPEKLISDNLTLLLEDQKFKESVNDNVKSNISNEDNVPIYFRSVVFSPDVPIRLDYNGKRVELSHGPLAGLLMGLGQLECSELTLKRITHKHGILGVDKLCNFLMQQWLQDIKKKQLPSLLGGIGPIHSVVQLFQGIRDLFWLPIEQYQKDGRIVRGLQRGANSFTACTALAALQITTRIIHIIQATAETAFDMVSPGPSVKRGSQSSRKKGRKGRTPLNPPQDIREGVANAYQVVIEGLGDTASNLVHVASVEHSHKGVSGAVGGVLRQLPPTVVAPLVIASQATQHVLGGVTSQLVPDARLDAKQKWRVEERS